MSESIITTCRACGCAGFATETGCRACGFGSTRLEEKTVDLPTARNAEEREAMFRKIVTYAIATQDVDGAVRALSCGRMAEGSAIAKALLGAA